jgi:hypothetical protein
MTDDEPTAPNERSPQAQAQHMRAQLRQLILMRETGPKRSAWHAARARLIWRLHDELRRVEAAAGAEAEDLAT